MFAKLIAKSSQSTVPSALRSRTRRMLLVLLFAVCFVAGFAYHLAMWNTGAPFARPIEFAYNVVVLIGYGALWFLLAYFIKQRQAAPAKIFWTTFLIGVFFVGISRLLTSVGTPPRRWRSTPPPWASSTVPTSRLRC